MYQNIVLTIPPAGWFVSRRRSRIKSYTTHPSLRFSTQCFPFTLALRVPANIVFLVIVCDIDSGVLFPCFYSLVKSIHVSQMTSSLLFPVSCHETGKITSGGNIMFAGFFPLGICLSFAVFPLFSLLLSFC